MNKHLQCLKYIVRHKYFVFVAGRKTGASLWRLLIHDWTKLLPSEWGPYAEHFYSKPPIQRQFDRPNHDQTVKDWKEAISQEFDRAWLHHIHRHDHHWQHWVLREDSGAVKCLEMDEAAWREMVADWMSAGRTIHGRWRALEWYFQNMDKLKLHDDTRRKVEILLVDMHALGMA